MLLSIDQGTSSTRCIAFSAGVNTLNMLASAQHEHHQYYPNPGYVEHDPDEIWSMTKKCITETLGKVVGTEKLLAIGITNQRETTILWNRKTGKPYHNAIVWNDSRTSDICLEFAQHNEYVRQKTGLPVAPYFSVTKILYLLRAIPGLRDAAANGDVCFGTIDSWLIWNLTGGLVHATDVTNASRTSLMNIWTLEWDEDLLNLFDIPQVMLPKIYSSSEIIAHVSPCASDCDELHSIIDSPIAGVLGDQQAALFGQRCYRIGDVKCTYGTGAFVLLNVGSSCRISSNGLLTTIAYRLGNNVPIYALEGSIAYCGSVMQWLRDNLSILDHASKSEEIASNVTSSDGVVFVPAFAGLFAPYWRSDARGIICGLTAYHTHSHIVRAALEAAAFQVWEVLGAMSDDPIPCLRVDGGMAKNNMLMQFQSDILGAELLAPVIVETTAMGAAIAAGLGIGIWNSVAELSTSDSCVARKWQPTISQEQRQRLLVAWRSALKRSIEWTTDITSSEPEIILKHETSK